MGRYWHRTQTPLALPLNSPGAPLKLPRRSPQTTQALSLYPTCPNALPHVSRGLAPRGPTVLPHLTQRRCPTCPTALPHLPKQIWPRAPKGWRQGSLGIASREFQTRVSPTAEKCQGTAIFKIGTAKNSNQRDKMSRLIDRRVLEIDRRVSAICHSTHPTRPTCHTFQGLSTQGSDRNKIPRRRAGECPQSRWQQAATGE